MMDLLNVDLNAVRNGKVKRSDKVEPLLGLNYRGLLDAATNIPVAGDVLSGGLAIYDAAKGDYGSAALNALGVLPFVSGTFIGKGAKTWDKVKEADAMSRLAKGDDAAKVWSDTGIGKAPWDKIARSEIDDSKSALRPSVAQFLQKQDASGAGAYSNVPLSDIFKHDQLGRAYPQTEGTTASLYYTNGANAGGAYQDAIDRILVTSRGPMEAHSTTLHELQHGIQNREGWAKGGNPEQFKVHPDTLNGLHSIDDMMRAELILNRANEYGMSVQDFTKNPARWMDDKAVAIARRFDGKPKDFTYAKNFVIGAHDPQEAYQRLAGEAEARLTQYRMALTPQERLAQYPYDPAYFKQATGVDINDLIVRGGLLGE